MCPKVFCPKITQLNLSNRFNWPFQPLFNLFSFFTHNLQNKNCRLQQDSNLDRLSGMPALRPLDRNPRLLTSYLIWHIFIQKYIVKFWQHLINRLSQKGEVVWPQVPDSNLQYSDMSQGAVVTTQTRGTSRSYRFIVH